MSKVDLTPAKLAELRQKAEACDPKIWEIDKYGNVVSVAHTVAECGFVATCGSDEDTQFIAAADPATVLALVEELTVVRLALLELAWEFYGRDQTREEMESCCAAMIENERAVRRESEAGQ